MMAQADKPAEPSRIATVWGRPDLHSKFQTSQPSLQSKILFQKTQTRNKTKLL